MPVLKKTDPDFDRKCLEIDKTAKNKFLRKWFANKEDETEWITWLEKTTTDGVARCTVCPTISS